MFTCRPTPSRAPHTHGIRTNRPRQAIRKESPYRKRHFRGKQTGPGRHARHVVRAALRLLAAVVMGAGWPPAGAHELDFIQVDPKHPTMLRHVESGTPFVAIGLNYFGPHTGWAPKLWHQFDPTTVRRHLQLIHQQGFNTIRVFLTLDSFHQQPGIVREEGLRKFRQFLQLCHEANLYVIPSGPDHWEGRPHWIRAKDQFADGAVRAVTAQWWTRFAALFKDEPAILAWDLLNEPSVAWNSSAMRTQWSPWLKKKYTRIQRVADEYGTPVEQLRAFGQVPVPARNLAAEDPRMRDYQEFRESIANQWTRQLVTAIRRSDRKHLITIGYIQWSSNAYLPAPSVYAGFDPERNSKFLDFVTIHFYPLAPPRPCDSPRGIARNAEYLAQLLDQCRRPGKPVVIGEFGWYGGGAIRRGDRVVMPPQTESDQVAWNNKLLEVSRGRVCGWLNWAFADTPTSQDLTRWSGIWTEDLELKPWGRAFGQFARATIAHPAVLQRGGSSRPRPF